MQTVVCKCCGKDASSEFCSCHRTLKCERCNLCGKHCDCQVPKLVPVDSPTVDRAKAPKPPVPNGEQGRCRGPNCRATIYWVLTTSGNRTPRNADGTSHFATCPDSASFRKEREGKNAKGKR